MATEPSAQPQEPAGEPIPQGLLDKALDNLRQLARGNGVPTGVMSIKSFEGKIYTLDARQVFRIIASGNEMIVNGRPQGPALKSREELQEEIRSAASRTASSPGIRPVLMEILNKRDDMGFGLNGETLDLPLPASRYVVPLPCDACHGAKTVACASCRGSGRSPCMKCQGRREITCLACRGTQFQFAGQERVSCRVCRGRGRVGCPTCRQLGHTPCLKCRSAGKIPCRLCGGTGFRSLVASITYKAESRLEYDRTALPYEASSQWSRMKGGAFKGRHIEARFAPPPSAAMEKKTEEVMIPCHIRVPSGAITFAVGAEEVKGRLFGMQGLLTNLPPFLEMLAAPGLRALSEAAAPGGHVAGPLERAIRYRLTADIVLAVASFAPLKAYHLLQKRYPQGIGEDALKQAVRDASSALRRIGRKPRLIGFGIGTMLSLIIYGLWFLLPLRPRDLFVMDLAFVVVCALAAFFCIRYTAARAIGRVLGRLQKNGRKRFLPDTASSAFLAASGSLGTGLLMLQVCALKGMALPSWYAALLHTAGF